MFSEGRRWKYNAGILLKRYSLRTGSVSFRKLFLLRTVQREQNGWNGGNEIRKRNTEGIVLKWIP